MRFYPLVAGVLLLASVACNSRNSKNEVVFAEKKTVVPGSEEALSYLALQQRVKEIFETQCYTCHGQNGANAGNIGDVRNINALVEKGLLSIGAPAEQSKIYQRMVSKTQPMPPKGNLPDAQLKIVKTWLERQPETRTNISYEEVYKAIEADFEKFSAEEKVNIRYFHLVNNYNSGAPKELLEQIGKSLSKMFNMLSTSEKIIKPAAIPIRNANVIYRVNLKDYELERPETMYTYMLKAIAPMLNQQQREKWMPAPEESDPNNYYGARYKEIFEGKQSISKFINPDIHTFKQGLPVPDHPILNKMARQMREAAQKVDPSTPGPYGTISDVEKRESERCRAEDNPVGLLCSQPLPLMRADWFVAQVSGNMRMRIYYHAAGMDDDTVTLDAALGIDDAEGSLYDNDPNFDRNSIPKEQRIIRAGFNNSGVSINHRAFERIPLYYFPGRALWRAYEFKDKLKDGYQKHDIFKFAAGPIFEIGSDGEPGFECVNFMTNRFTRLPDGRTVRTLSLMDHGILYPSKLPGNAEPKVVSDLKRIRGTAATPEPTANTRYTELMTQFQDLFGHRDYFRWQADAYIAQYGQLPVRNSGLYSGTRMLKCEIEESNPLAFRHETLEYLLLKRNGLQAFVNVGLKAEHADYKVPNQRALENKEALLIPAHDRNELMVVGAPLSCLSCHAKGLIEKEDQVARFISDSPRPEGVNQDFWDRVRNKITNYHVPFGELKEQMAKDNSVFRTALEQTGVSINDPEPVVDTYRNWAIPGLAFAQVAEELEITQERLKKVIAEDSAVASILREFRIPGSTIRRSEFERGYRTLMCRIHKSCKTIDPANIIPNQ